MAYGEWKAYEGAKARAEEAATDEERLAYRKVAAEELRHHKGFRGRLEALGADPERAMRPYRRPLDHYHAGEPGSPVEEAVWSYLGEGVADDLLQWLRRVVDAETAAFMAESQVPWGVEALAGAITEPAWKTKPSWYLVVTDDRMIPPAAQRFMSKRAGSTVRESPGSHAIYVSRPAPVVALIEQAATALATASR